MGLKWNTRYRRAGLNYHRYIHWIQDVPDQRAIVRQYMKYEHEIRSPHNAAQITLRALQFATTSPQGPTYLTASREALEARTSLAGTGHGAKASKLASSYLAVEPIGISPGALDELGRALVNAERPLIVTSYCGRSSEGFEALKSLAELLSIPVHENAATWNNFPTTSFLHQGHQWNGGGQLPELAAADVVLVVDSDVPWIPVQSRPSDQARIFHLDSDPLKTSMTLWGLVCERRWQCDSSLALAQLAEYIANKGLLSTPDTQAKIDARVKVLHHRFAQRQAQLEAKEEVPEDGLLTVPYFMSRLRKATAGLKVIGLNESTTNLPNVADHLRHDHAKSLIGSGGGGLGWWSGAAVGAYMGLETMNRECELIVAFVGDGTWIFGVPSSAYWMARKYQTPYLTIIWNNGGWAAPRAASLRIHEHLAAQESFTHDIGVGIQPSPDFGMIAQGAGDAWTAKVTEAEQADLALRDGLRAITVEKRCAVIEVVLKAI